MSSWGTIYCEEYAQLRSWRRGDHLLQGGTIYPGANYPWGNSYSEVYCPGDQLLQSKLSGGPPTSGAHLLRDSCLTGQERCACEN